MSPSTQKKSTNPKAKIYPKATQIALQTSPTVDTMVLIDGDNYEDMHELVQEMIKAKLTFHLSIDLRKLETGELMDAWPEFEKTIEAFGPQMVKDRYAISITGLKKKAKLAVKLNSEEDFETFLRGKGVICQLTCSLV